MKRKNESFFYRNRSVLNDIAFDFTSKVHHHVIKCETISGKSHYKFQFDKPLCSDTYLTITHMPSKRQDICLNLTSEINEFIKTDKFFVYETHSISIDMKCMYIGLENINLCGYDDQENVYIYRPMFDLGINFFDKTMYKRLNYIAPDKIAGIDASQISQNNPLWTKRAGAITSSSVQKYLGFFVPESDFNWTLQTKNSFTGWMGVRVRFGSMKEDDMILTYLNSYPNRIFKQTGYSVHPNNPKKWGASPDGIVIVDGKRRIVEFKASMTGDCNFKGYYIAQVLWEMECLGVKTGDLVKYSEKKRNTNDTAKITCRVATIHQDVELQAEIEKLVEESKKVTDSAKFKKLVYTQKYIDIREKLDNIARNLAYDEINVPFDKVNEMYTYMKNIYLLKDLSRMSGHSTHTLKYYLQLGLFEEIGRSPETNFRYFDDTSIEVLRSIRQLRLKGFSLKDIKEKMQV